MLRVLLSVLAVVAAVLAIVLERPILYAAAGALVVMVVILWIAALQRHRRATKPYSISTKAPPPPEENLKSLGIMDIRPKEPTPKFEKDPDSVPVSAQTTPPLSAADDLVDNFVDDPVIDETFSETVTDEPIEPDLFDQEEAATDEESVDEGDERDDEILAADEEETTSEKEPVVVPDGLKEFVIEPTEPPAVTEPPTNGVTQAEAAPYDAAVLHPYLQALRAALGAHTAALLKQDDVAFDYHVVALIDEHGTPHSGHRFAAQPPLLTASMARQSVTVREVDPDDLPPSSLGYSNTPEAVRQVALAPIPRSVDPDVYYLLADTLAYNLLDQPRARLLMVQFARLLGTLLDVPTPALAPADAPPTEKPLRPRREIIAEEMEQARAHNQSLALAIIYLNRAEAIANTGEEAVAEAEQLLEGRLHQVALNGRVVRFGELTYGVFYDGPLLEVEAWGGQIQQTLAHETSILKGGVSIGIALLQDRHQTPDAFRADATEALREAYETGTCTILA